MSGREEKVKFLIEKVTEVNSKDTNGETSLHWGKFRCEFK